MPVWFWQGLLTNWLSAAIVFLGGIMLAFLKARGSRFTSPLLYGLVAVVLLTALILMVRVGGTLPVRIPITPENADSNVRSWVERAGFSVKTEQSPDTYFTLHLTGISGSALDIYEPKKFSTYIFVTGNLAIAPEHNNLLDKMSNPEKQDCGVGCVRYGQTRHEHDFGRRTSGTSSANLTSSSTRSIGRSRLIGDNRRDRTRFGSSEGVFLVRA